MFNVLHIGLIGGIDTEHELHVMGVLVLFRDVDGFQHQLKMVPEVLLLGLTFSVFLFAGH